MEDITQITIQLIGSEVCQNSVSLPADIFFTEKNLVEILILSKKHGLAHIVASALLKKGLLNNSPQKDLFLKELYSAVYSQEKIKAVFDRVCLLLEENEVEFIPLKGAVIRELYPQPWMRSSCDIDILIKEENIKTTVDFLVESAGFQLKSESNHDVVLISKEGICLELHFKLIGNEKSSLYSNILKNVWKSAEPVCKGSFRYKFSDDIFYYYHILHMAKHFKIGGCGLRPFVDLWLINHSEKYDLSKSCSMLKNSKVADFEYYAKKLSEVWFSGKEHDDVTLAMQNFVVDGGTFGSEKTRAFANRSREGGKFRYLLSRIFVPYSYLKSEYEIIEKYPFLTPICEICRICSILFGKKKKLKKKQFESLKGTLSNDSYDNELFKILGL